MRRQNVKFSSGTKGRRIEVKFALLKEFGRKPESLNAHALCVMALLTLDPKVNVLGFEFDPVTYDSMTVTVSNVNSLGPLSMSQNFGSATLSLEDGRCGELQEG